MKFLIGGFSHESNAFCEHITSEADFSQWELVWGDEVIERHRGKHTVLGGFIEGLREGNHTMIGSVSAMAVPSGPVEAGFYRRIKEGILDAARKAGELDGVLLSLHGAMFVEESAAIFDPEGELIAALRDVVGEKTVIAAVFDLHSDTTDLLLEKADLTLAYNEEPHRDGYERGLEAVELTQRIMRGEIKPTIARQRVPMLLPAINMATDQGPMHDLHQLRAALEAKPGVIDISIHAGFYGSDQPEAGFSVVCTTDNDPNLAREMAQMVAEAAWKKREEFIIPLMPIDEAVRQSLAVAGPVGLIDEADDPAGGGSGDSVAVLRGMLTGGISAGGVSTVKDTEVVRKMAQLGEGGWLEVFLGGKTDSLHGEPLKVSGIVRKIYDKPIPIDSWSGKLYPVGLLGVLDVSGVLVVVTETKIITENIDIFEILGFDVRKMQAACFKGLGLHIRQALAGKVDKFIPVDGVGVTHPDVRKLGKFKYIRRPVWPLDDIPLEAYLR